MELKDIKPFVRFSRLLKISENSVFSECYPIDARLFYTESGEGKIKVGDEIFTMRPHSLIFINSGQNYHLLQGNVIYNAINFDFTDRFLDLSEPIPPINIGAYSDGEALEDVTIDDAPCFDKYCFMKDVYPLESHFLKIKDLFERKVPFYRLEMSIELSHILLKIAQKSEKMAQKIDSFNIDRIIEYIQNHHNEEISNSALAEIFHFHPNYINSELKKYTGKSLHSYVLELRILKALAMMESGSKSITEIASACGFNSNNYFSRYFKKKTGISPKQAMSIFK